MSADKEKSLASLRKSLEKIGVLEKVEEYSLEHQQWENSARHAISSIFPGNSQYLKALDAALKPYSSENELYPLTKANAFRKVSRKLTALFETMIAEVEEWEVSDNPEPAKAPLPVVQNVFLIHGHDVGAKEQVARFISKLGLNPLILHEQANQGKTVIEKFEQYTDVAFAIAILTPDDQGAANANVEHLRPRPRQNVLFEFGYFIGKLGRRFVCGLVKGELEIPSDYSGVLLIELDTHGFWKVELIKELKAAGLQIDANTAF